MSRRVRRGFTLIETMLAAALGSLVLVAILGITSLVDRAESSSKSRLERTAELERAQTVIRRALGSLAMAGGSAPVQQNRSNQSAEDGATQDTTAGMTFTPTPRLVLASMQTDPMAAAAMGDDISTVGAGAQRLQFALTMLPLPEQAFLAPSASSTNRSQAGGSEGAVTETIIEPTDEGSTEGTPEDAAAVTEDDTSSSELVPIFWGALELTPPDVFSSDPEKEGWTLWWRQIPEPANSSAAMFGIAPAPVVQIADPRMDPGAIALVRGVSSAKWSVYRGRELLPAYAATYSGDLPAYMQLELRTTAGVYANWMFELGWATVQEPGQVAMNRAAAQLRAERGARDGIERGGQGGEGGDARLARPGPNRGRGGQGDRFERPEGTGQQRMGRPRPQSFERDGDPR